MSKYIGIKRKKGGYFRVISLLSILLFCICFGGIDSAEAFSKKEVSLFSISPNSYDNVFPAMLPNGSIAFKSEAKTVRIVDDELNLIKELSFTYDVQAVKLSNLQNLMVITYGGTGNNTSYRDVFVYNNNGNLISSYYNVSMYYLGYEIDEAGNGLIYSYYNYGGSTTAFVIYNAYGKVFTNNDLIISKIELYKNNQLILYGLYGEVTRVYNTINWSIIANPDLSVGLYYDKSIAKPFSKIADFNDTRLTQEGGQIILYKKVDGVYKKDSYYIPYSQATDLNFSFKNNKLYYTNHFSPNYDYFLGFTYEVDAITNLAIKETTDNSCKLTFNIGNNHPTYNYLVEYREIGENTWMQHSKNNLTERIINNLLPDTNYEIRVRHTFTDVFGSLWVTPNGDYWKTIKLKTLSADQIELEGIRNSVLRNQQYVESIQSKIDDSNYGLIAITNKLNTNNSKLETIENNINNIVSSITPIITKVNGVNNSTATKTGTITIEISSSNATEYRARDKAGAWSEWTTSNTIPVLLLSKGVRTIEIQARNGGEGSAVANHTMTVFSL